MEQSLEDVTVRLTVKKDLAKKFASVKEWYGLIHDTELIRVLVSEKYHSIKKRT